MSDPIDTTEDLSGDNRPTRYIETDEDGKETVVYRASGLAHCDRRFVALSQGHYAEPLPDFMREIFNEGHRTEPLIRAMYEEQTGKMVELNDGVAVLELGTMHGRHVIVRGSTDGQVAGESTLFEAKKFRESTWPKFQQSGVECNVNYPWQVSAYMHGRDLEELDFVGGRITTDEWGEITLHEIEVKHLAQPPIPLHAIYKRIKHLEDLINTGFAPGEVACEKADYPCPYFRLHDDDLNVVELDDRFADVLTRLNEATKTAAAAGTAKKKADDAKKVIAEELRVMLAEESGTASNAKKLTGQGFEVTHTISVTPEHTVKESTRDFFKIKETKK